MARAQPLSPTPDEVRATREAVGLSQTDAAALIDQTRASWARYEDGTRALNPILWQVWRIRAGLDKAASILKR